MESSKRKHNLLQKLTGYPKVFYKTNDSGIQSVVNDWNPNKIPSHNRTYYNFKR